MAQARKSAPLGMVAATIQHCSLYASEKRFHVTTRMEKRFGSCIGFTLITKTYLFCWKYHQSYNWMYATHKQVLCNV